jgi:acetyltransferase-like isoleucine patch superfamily enzyme
MKKLFIHKSALVETPHVEDNTSVLAFSHIMSGALIGENCHIGTHCFIETGVIIGDNVTVKDGVSLWQGVMLEDDVFVGTGAIFINELHPRTPHSTKSSLEYAGKSWLNPILVQQGATISAGAMLMPGVTIAPYATVAIGSVVIQNVPAHAFVMGNPAKQCGWVCYCGYQLNQQLTCTQCSSTYCLDFENKLQIQKNLFSKATTRIYS